MQKKLLMIGMLSMVVTSASALSWSSIFGGDGKVGEVVSKVVETVSPEEQVKKLIDKCATPTTDGICECVANAVLANLTPDQWKTVNHYLFDTRRTVNVSEFLIANPWIVPKIATPYVQCNSKK
ncbi:MAG: hypothetical protein FWF97_03475 [Alphaproteobacteria bacterium]|nr:hypothetical protein [Alphaproteobacteria bacterium]